MNMMDMAVEILQEFLMQTILLKENMNIVQIT